MDIPERAPKSTGISNDDSKPLGNSAQIFAKNILTDPLEFCIDPLTPSNHSQR